MEIAKLTAKEIAAGLAAKEFSAVEVVQASLDRAAAASAVTQSFLEIYADESLAAAKESDARWAAGEARSPYDGLPVGVKDNILMAGRTASAGSNMLKQYRAAYDATVVSKLKAAGCVLLGRTNMDEFAMGSTTESSAYGPTKNPWDLTRVPGGSSGGSAAAVAEGSVPVALGSDTGGSVRQPAALCGCVGYKPTYGRVSRYGLILMSSGLDQIGPLAKTVADAAAVLKLIEGQDRNDSNSVPLKDDWQLADSWPTELKGVKIGLPKEFFGGGLDPQVEESVRAAAAQCEALGAELVEVSLPHAKYALSVYYILMPSEVSANLARFDGVRYGHRAAADDLIGMYRETRGQGFGPEVRRRIMIGTHALSSGYYDAYYNKSLQVRRLIANDYRQALDQCDVILSPTSPLTAWPIGQMADDPLQMYLADVYTVSANVAGLPAISLPSGLADGRPVGVQLFGRHFADSQVLGVAHAYEQARGPLPAPKLEL
jgi:aspartyl-tRNA(Asn)/glutamyl-tRNA(Gln) amidotransferase subunit A